MLLDLDGVITRTASIHARAWRMALDPMLARHARRTGTAMAPFGTDDYRTHVDGKPRRAGLLDFLAARGITLPEGQPDDAADADTIQAIAAAKQHAFVELLGRDGVPADPAAAPLLRRWRAAGLQLGLVTSSRNGRDVLTRTGLTTLFDTIVDGNTLAERKLAGKPAPDGFLAAAAALGVAPRRAAVVEDATAGVAAGRNGAFGLVVGIARAPQLARALTAAGADLVIADLGELDYVAQAGGHAHVSVAADHTAATPTTTVPVPRGPSAHPHDPTTPRDALRHEHGEEA